MRNLLLTALLSTALSLPAHSAEKPRPSWFSLAGFCVNLLYVSGLSAQARLEARVRTLDATLAKGIPNASQNGYWEWVNLVGHLLADTHPAAREAVERLNTVVRAMPLRKYWGLLSDTQDAVQPPDAQSIQQEATLLVHLFDLRRQELLDTPAQQWFGYFGARSAVLERSREEAGSFAVPVSFPAVGTVTTLIYFADTELDLDAIRKSSKPPQIWGAWNSRFKMGMIAVAASEPHSFVNSWIAESGQKVDGLVGTRHFGEKVTDSKSYPGGIAIEAFFFRVTRETE